MFDLWLNNPEEESIIAKMFRMQRNSIINKDNETSSWKYYV